MAYIQPTAKLGTQEYTAQLQANMGSMGIPQTTTQQPATIIPPTPTTPATPIKDIFNTAPTRTQAEIDLDQANTNKVNAYALDTTPTSTDRASIIGGFQQQIDALNQVYAQEKQKAAVAGEQRLGGSAAIQARRGLLGSDFGAAATVGVNQANQEEQQAIDAQHKMALASVYSNIDKSAREAATNRVEAARKGADAKIAEIQGRQANQEKAVSSAVAAYVASQLGDTSKLTDQNIMDWAKTLGTSNDVIVNAVKTAKSAYDTTQAATAKAEMEAAKPLDIGDYTYIYNPKTKKYENQGMNTKPSTSGGLTPYQQFSATQSISKDNQKRTESAREMQRQANLIKTSYDNITKGGNRSLNTQAIVTSFNKILDPTSVVRESEYDRTAQGQSLLAQLQGKYDNIVAGGAGVTEETLKEAATIADRYLTSSAASIKAENDRAMKMAEAFKLNPEFVGSTTFGQTGTGKSIEDYKLEFPNATTEELQALMAEEQ